MYIDFDNTTTYAKYWNDKTKMNYLQRHVLVHSYLYYHLNNSVISDKKYDELCKQLINMIKQYPEEYIKTEYYYCFYDFDGTTGFDLFNRLNDVDKQLIQKICSCIINGIGGI